MDPVFNNTTNNDIHSLSSFFSLVVPLINFFALLGFIISLIIIPIKCSNIISDHSINIILISSSTNYCLATMILSLFLISLIHIMKPYFSNSYSSRCPIYLVDFSCLKPPSSCRVPFSKFLENASKIECFDADSIEFMAKVLTASGQSQDTYLPPALHHIPPKSQHKDAINEAHMSLFTVMNDLLAKTKLSPQNVDFLVVNCSGFCPSPSLSSILVNKYAMRSDVKSFNLSGMGCSASAAAIDLAQSLLRVHSDSNAVILSTEILSQGWYHGREKPMLVLNCIFRMGSAAILLTNKKESKRCSKYELVKTVRTQRAFDDEAYRSGIREEDSQGNTGFNIGKNLLRVVGETLRSNVALLGRSILPMREKVRYLVMSMAKSGQAVPDFKVVISHFCLPTSGVMWIREIGKGLGLGEEDMEAALMTHRRFGNQSSSALWYEFAYLEAKERVREGEWVWQLGLGSGFKCTSVVWKSLRTINVGESDKGPWADCIHDYPVVAI